MGSQVENVRLTILPKRGKQVNTCPAPVLKQNPRWRRLPQMNVARSGHSLVVIEQVIIICGSLFPFFSINCFLLEVVFAVGGDTDTAEWLDIEAGNKNYLVEPHWYSCKRTLASVFHTKESGFSLPVCRLRCWREVDVW